MGVKRTLGVFAWALALAALAVLLCPTGALRPMGTAAQAPERTEPLGPPVPSSALPAQAPEWVEPRALNIVDLAGQVPDDVLAGAIIADSAPGGIALFRSAEVEGDLLRIHVTLRGRRFPIEGGFVSKIALLGQRPLYDHMYSVSPASWVRLYENGREVTDRVRWMDYLAADLRMPEADASDWNRYPSLVRTSFELPMEEHGLRVPANIGGELTLEGEHIDLEATFTFVRPTAARAQHLGTQEAAFPSFISPEDNVGRFNPLAQQMYARYQVIRHPRILLQPPAGANYILFIYPPMSFYVYDATGYNVQRPSSGTMRMATADGRLSQDLTHSGAFPLGVAWQDAAQSAGPYLSLMPPVDRITPPEFVVPPGMPYDPCFEEGGCSDAVLEAIYRQETPLRLVYLRVRPAASDLLPIPLRMLDDPRLPAAAAAAPAALDAEQDGSRTRLFVPLIYRPLQLDLPDDLARPAGLFTRDDGRMVGYLP